MKQVKVKGIVIREIPYKDNDKILTIMTDTLGKISCMAKGAKKNNSQLLASSQFLVYSEFLLYKGTSFYHINSAEMIDSFYDLRTNYDKLEIAFELSKILSKLTYENDEIDGVLSLFLNTLFVIKTKDMPIGFVNSIFKLKLLCLTGYAPHMHKCSACGKMLVEKQEIQESFYDRTSSSVICSDCYTKIKQESQNKGMGMYRKLSDGTLLAILYVVSSDIKKVFGFEIKDKTLKEFESFVDEYYLNQTVYSL